MKHANITGFSSRSQFNMHAYGTQFVWLFSITNLINASTMKINLHNTSTTREHTDIYLWILM